MQVLGTGDYDGNGAADIVWRNTSTGANTLWPGADSAQASALTTVPTDWTLPIQNGSWVDSTGTYLV